jgi:lipoprotein-anchoring transpeptidase ErfK/SrfK/peptidoglycan hydrolase-like protein with peptidoglycan-binding domain
LTAQRVSKEVAIDIARTTQTSASWLGIAALALLVAAGPAEAGQKQKKAPDAEPIADVDNSEPMLLVVSVAAQKVDIYRGTSLLTTSAVSTGMAAHPTMIGAFSIIEKQRWHHSNIYSGAPMPWMNRITWSGTALHAGVVPGYPASHGCIRLTYAFAPKMFQMTTVGDNVIVSRGRPKPVLIEHPNLFQPAPPPAPPEAAEVHIAPTRADSPSLPAMAAVASPVILARAESSTTVDSEEQGPAEPAATHSQTEPPATVSAKHAVPDEASDPNRVHAITPDVDDGAKTHAVPDPAASAPAAIPATASAAAVTPVPEAHEAPAAVTAAPEAPAAAVTPPAPATPAKIPPAAAKIDAGIAAAAMQAAEPRSEAPLRMLLTRRTQRDRIIGVQQIFASLGYLPAQDFDGTMGKATITAVKAFQKANGMPETGAFTDALVKKVYEVAGKGEPPAGHLFVRQSLSRLFDTPVNFRDPEQPLGTHVYTALKFAKGDSKARWMTVDVQDGDGIEGPLDRIEIPSDVRQEISERLTPGSTFIVADTSINSANLPKGGDFVVLAKSTAGVKISQADDDASTVVKKPHRRPPTFAKRYYNSPWGGNGPWYGRPW